METALTTLDYNDNKVLQTIQETIAVEATPPELQMFIQFCQSTGLNPLKKEVWFIKTKGYTRKDGSKVDGKVQIMTGINGFYSIANNHPQYDGMEEVEFGENEKGEIIWAKAKVWRKDRRFPSVGVADWAEFFPGTTEKGNSLWETKPRVMLAKVAESIALRKAFPQELNGMYTAEEMPAEYARREPVNVVQVEPPKLPPLVRTVDADTGEVTEKRLPDPFAAGKKEIDFSKLPWRYHIPYKKAGKDMEAVRTWMKEKGFHFNESDKHWYGPFEVAKMAEYYRPLESSGLQAKPESVIPFVISEDQEFHDDMLPPNF